MHRSSQISVLLLVLAVASCLATTWDEERLQWLVVTPPGQRNVQLNCTSQNIYPFHLLNDSSTIGALGSPVKQVWWILPDGLLANETYDDGNRRVVNRGVGLLVLEATESAFGLYHCAVEANTAINDTQINFNSTTVYYYKRGLNLYGPDLYGNNIWEKYKRNTLIGSLTAGIFLVFVAGYALLNRFGVLAKCGGSNAVEAAPGAVEVGEMSSATAVAAAGAKSAEAKAAEAEMTPAASVAQSSGASLRSRRSEKATPPGTEAETAA